MTGCSNMAPKVSSNNLIISNAKNLTTSQGKVNIIGYVGDANNVNKSIAEGAAIDGSVNSIKSAFKRWAPKWHVNTELLPKTRWDAKECKGEDKTYTISLLRVRQGGSNLADIKMHYQVLNDDCVVLKTGVRKFESYTAGRAGFRRYYYPEGLFYGHKLAPIILGSISDNVITKGRIVKKNIIAQENKRKQENEINKARIALYKRSEPCPMKEEGWFYKSGTCKNGVADGKGEAVHRDGVLSFKGRFVKGKRTKGLMLANNVDVFDGKIVGGKPAGKGICFYSGEPEECKYYRGKRVDAIYKQRIALERQQKQIDEKMAEMKREQQSQLSAMKKSMQNQSTASQDGNGIGDALAKEASKKVMSEIFNRLF